MSLMRGYCWKSAVLGSGFRNVPTAPRFGPWHKGIHGHSGWLQNAPMATYDIQAYKGYFIAGHAYLQPTGVWQGCAEICIERPEDGAYAKPLERVTSTS